MQSQPSLAYICVWLCVKDYVYIYDGIPLYPGFSSEGATPLATLCGFISDETLTVTAESGVMTVFFEAVVTSRTSNHSCVCLLLSVVDVLSHINAVLVAIFFRTSFHEPRLTFQFCSTLLQTAATHWEMIISQRHRAN